MDDYLFDLRGYLVLKDAVEPELVDALNHAFDTFPALAPGEWWGNAQRRDYTDQTGFELHNCVEAGEPFERLIDHPSWIARVMHYCGEEDSYVSGVFIDECIASIRTSGGHHPAHSGGYHGALRGWYAYKNGVFRCGQVNIIVALTDIGEGDGPTMVVPGSHKSNFPHPGGRELRPR
jgi:ectoine hydroxylase-related dioxygenase (phytanoyl-CoA dioxygenase family)